MAQLPVVAPLDMQDQKITDLQRPTNPADAATMEYADNATTGVEIAPLSVRVGGVSGSHVLRTASTNSRAGDLVNQRNSALTDSSFETLAGGNRLVIHSPPIQRDGADLTQGDEFVMTVADSALAANLPNGTYLVSFVGYVTGADSEVDTVFDDIRPLDAQGTAGTALTLTNSNGFSAVGSNISFFEEIETLASFEFHNTDTNENVLTVNYTTEVVDFSQNPTVNGVAIGGGANISPITFTVSTTIGGDITATVQNVDTGSPAENIAIAQQLNMFLNGLQLDKDITDGTYDRATGQITLVRNGANIVVDEIISVPVFANPSPDGPAGYLDTEGNVWYNSNTSELKYRNRNRDVVVIDSQNIQTIVNRDIAAQRMEDHSNTEGEFSFTQETTQSPANQRNVLANNQWIAARTDDRTGVVDNTLTSLQYDSNFGGNGRLRIWVSDPTLSGTDAGRKAFLQWWTTEFRQNQETSTDGIIDWLDPLDNVGFTASVSAVGNVPAGESRGVTPGEAYIELEILSFDNGNDAGSIFTGNRLLWLQSDGTDIGGVPEDSNDYFFLASEDHADWMSRFRTEAEVDIRHQNAAYVARVNPAGQTTFEPRQVPVIFEESGMYYAGQFVFNAGIAGGGLFAANQDVTPGPFNTANWTPIPFTEVEWAGKLFDTNGFYEPGDVATLGTGASATAWIYNGTEDLDGRITPISSNDGPNGINNLWTRVGGGGGVISSITGTPSDTLDVPKWVSTNSDGTFNLRWESDIAQGGGFPDVGGIALLGFGQTTDVQAFSWPATTPTIEGENPNLWDYTPGSNVSAGTSGDVAATLIYNGTDDIVLSDSRIDGDIEITDLPSDNALNIQVIIATNSNPSTGQILYRGEIAATVNATGIYRFTSTNEINAFTASTGQPFFIYLQEAGSDAFSYDVTDIRLSFTNAEFVSVGGGDTEFVQHTDTPNAYTGAGNAVVRVNGGETALEFDTIVNTYPNGGTLLNDISIPSAEYVLDAVDPVFNYTMPLLTRDLVADQRYDVSFTSVLDNADGFSIRGDDIMFNGQRVSAIYRWNSSLNRWIQNDTDSTLNLQDGVDALNQFQVSFDSIALGNIRNHHVIETAEVTFNQDNTMVRNGVRLPFATSTPDDHRQVIENEQNIAINSSRIDALETEVHNLEQDGTRIRTNAFHSVTIDATTTDEVIAYHSSHSGAGVFTPLPLSMTVSPSGTGTVTAGSNQLPEALANPINEHLNQVFANMVPTQDQFRRTNVGADSDFVWNGALDFTFATLALSVDAQTFMIPLQITIDSFGRVHHALRDVWPVDDEITWSHIGVRWFLSGDTSLNLGPVPADTPDGRQQLAVPMTLAQRTQYYVDHEFFTTVHFVDQNGQTRNINVDIPETPPTTFPTAPTWQDGFVYALVTLESTDEVEPGVGSHITINVGANPFTPVETIPLALWKTNIWLGTEGLNGTTEFTTDQGLQTVTWTPYTTGGYTLWFIDNLNITADGNFIFNGDGLITTANPSVAANITPSNTINFIG